MSTDIRRMSREDLDRMNAEGKAWRERKAVRPGADQAPEPSLTSPTSVAVGEQLSLPL
jgi:hypothetical protein